MLKLVKKSNGEWYVSINIKQLFTASISIGERGLTIGFAVNIGNTSYGLNITISPIVGVVFAAVVFLTNPIAGLVGVLAGVFA